MAVSEQMECPLCKKAEPDFQRINEKINRAATIPDKVSHARALLQKVESVLKEHETTKDGLAGLCQAVLKLRKSVAELILKLEK